jgi:hypothetical protein
MSSHKKFTVFFIVLSFVFVLACQSISNIISTPTVTSSTSVQNLEGTIWSGIDSGGKSFVYEFLPDGVLKYTTETGTFTDGSWKQDGKLVYFEMNNKYAEHEGVISDNWMTGNGWNQVGYKWTWSASNVSTSQILGAKETPESSSNTVNYDGDWKGTTSQDMEVTFTVARNGINKMKFQAKWDGLNCSRTFETTIETSTQAIDPTAEALGNFPPANPINNATFSLAQDTSSTDGTAYTITGTFLSSQKASGIIEYVVTSGSCQGTKKFDWTATKVSN